MKNAGKITDDEVHSAFIIYSIRQQQSANKIMDLRHVFVPTKYRGKRLAERIVFKAFKIAEDHSMRVRPTCSYVRDTFLRRLKALQGEEWHRIERILEDGELLLESVKVKAYRKSLQARLAKDVAIIYSESSLSHSCASPGITKSRISKQAMISQLVAEYEKSLTENQQQHQDHEQEKEQVTFTPRHLPSKRKRDEG
jgi:predicted GNAT family acetyltransferase